MTVYLLAGHYKGPMQKSRSGKVQSQGTEYPGTPRQSEADAVIELRGLVAKYLKRPPVTESDTAALETTREWLKSKVTNKDIVVELHFDSNDGTSPGTKSVVSENCNQTTAQMARDLVAAVSTVLGVPNKGLIQRNSQYSTFNYFANDINISMFEVCAMSKAEYPKYLAKKDAVAKAIADVINKYDTGETPTTGNTTSTTSGATGTPWIDIAKTYIGRTESANAAWVKEVHKEGSGLNASPSTAWCGSFVAYCLKKAGITPVKNPAWAANWNTYGKDVKGETIPYGAIITVPGVGGSNHHVTFCVGESNGKLQVLGGNQSNSVSITTYPRSSLIAARMPEGNWSGGSVATTGAANVTDLKVDLTEANKKANDAAKAMWIDPREGLTEVAGLPEMLKKRAELIDARNAGQDIGNYNFDVNAETEIEAIVNSITVAAGRIKGMNQLIDPSMNYENMGKEELVKKVYPWNKYINPFYYEMFGKDFHKDMNVKPLYFWAQESKLTPDILLGFNAADHYKMLYDAKYKAGLMGKEVEATAITDQLADSSENSENNDDHDNPEAMFLMLETRYIKIDRENDFSDLDNFDLADLLTTGLVKLGVPMHLARGMVDHLTGFLKITGIQAFGNIIQSIAGGTTDLISGVADWVTGNTTSTYTGEFPGDLSNRIGKLQKSQGLGIGTKHPPAVRAMMDLVSRHEGTHEARGSDGYQTYYARALKIDLNKPHVYSAVTAGRYTSTAAGRYQALKGTWNELMGSSTIMSADNQDNFFVKLLQQRNAYELVKSGDWDKIWTHFATKHPKAWTSLPTSRTQRVSAQHTNLTGNEWIQAAANLQKFYEGAKVGTDVTIDGPNALSRAGTNLGTVVNTLTTTPPSASTNNPMTYNDRSVLGNVQYERPKAGSLKYKKGIGGLTKTQYDTIAKTSVYKIGEGAGTVKHIEVLDAGLVEVTVRTPSEIKFKATLSDATFPKLKSYTGAKEDEYFASEAKDLAKRFLRDEKLSGLQIGWQTDGTYEVYIAGYNSELATANINIKKKDANTGKITNYSSYLLQAGAAIGNSGTAGAQLSDTAKKNKKGMWTNPEKVYTTINNTVAPTVAASAPKTLTDAEKKAKVQDFAPRTTIGEIFKDKVSRTPTKKSKINYTHDASGKWHTMIHFANDSNPSVTSSADKNLGIEIVAPLPGSLTISKGTNAGGIVATLKTDIIGLVLKFYNLSDKSFSISENGKQKVVKAGEVIGVIKGPGKIPELPFEALYKDVPFNPLCAKDLSTWPVNKPFRLIDYLNKNGFKSTSDQTILVSQQDWVKVHSDNGIVEVATATTPENVIGGVPSTSDSPATLQGAQKRSYLELRGHTYDQVRDPDGEGPLRDGASVFSNGLVYSNILKNFLKPFEYSNATMLPQIKGYIIVGNEDDDYYVEGTPIRQPIIYEMPAIQNFSLSCNDDYNPVDVARFILVNPSHMVSTPQWFDYNKETNIKAVHTQFFSPAFMDKAKIRSGTRVSFKIGYTNNPNFNPTIFNGVIKDVGSDKDYMLECIAEGFGAELLNTEFGSAKPINFTNGHNASTGAIFGVSLLDEAITHFGARLGTWRFATDYIGSIFRGQHIDEFASGAEWQNDTIFEGKGRIGDMRDPENKAMVAPWSWGDNIFNLWYPTRANAAHRVYVNIYSDVIESVHDNFATDMSSWWRLLSWAEAAAWRYFAYKSTAWSIMKEMEYRHPGTLCKPLIYDERMTMFFGIPFQNYIARDLSPHFMMSAALSNRFENLNNPYTKAYLHLRPSRMEPSTNYHMLHSDYNIISNQLTLSRDFCTRVNVLEYNRTFDGMDPDSSSEVHTITLDDNLAPHEIRSKTIALGGCHKEYNAWLYGTTELKKEVEKMYDGKIVIIGNPHIKAGDYAYLEDRRRGLSGTIKIRQCEHHITDNDGYITVITPGLWAEASQFAWSNHLPVLSSLGKYVADVLSEIGTEDILEEMAEYQAILVMTAKSSPTHFSDIFITAATNTAFAGMGGRIIVNRLWKSKLLSTKTGAAGNAMRGVGQSILNTSKAYGGKSLNAIKGTKFFQGASNFIKVRASNWWVFKTLGTAGKWLKNLKFTRGAIAMAKSALMLGRGVAAGIGAGIASIPIVGWIAAAITQVVFSFVAAKIDKERLTRQPVAFIPLRYNGSPYIAGVDGFINNSYLESMFYNLKQTWKTIVKANQYRSLQQGVPASDAMGNIAADIAKKTLTVAGGPLVGSLTGSLVSNTIKENFTSAIDGEVIGANN